MNAPSTIYAGRCLLDQQVAERKHACACGLAYSDVEFAKLPQRDVQEVEGGPDLRLANCKCGSTMAVPLPTHCEDCGEAFGRWAFIGNTLVPYVPHPRGNLLLRQARGEVDQLVDPPRRFMNQRTNDISKFAPVASDGPRFLSHWSVCKAPPHFPSESKNVR